jgi:prepilin signal peptidase PulO-like enzyme (type II secretory pathway)
MSRLFLNTAILCVFLAFLTVAGLLFIPIYFVLLFITRRQNRIAQRYTHSPVVWLMIAIGLVGLLNIVWAVNHPVPSNYPNQGEMLGALLFQYVFGICITWAYSLWWRKNHPLEQREAEAHGLEENVP